MGQMAGDIRRALSCAACALTFLIVNDRVAQADDREATVSRPATITAAPGPPDGQESAGGRRLIIAVTGFRPAKESAVQVVVKAMTADSGEQEIGRFGMFPNQAFAAPEPSQAQRFSLTLPKALESSGPVTLRVYVIPFKGEGKGASVELGDAEIR
ncbi:MAG: hypothetical protein U1E25_09960 [Methylocystis sp.]